MRKLYIAIIGATMIAGVAGCGKSDSTPATKQEVTAFKGHQPTPEQLKEAMSKMQSGPKVPPTTPK